jgi:hypothetical protein
MILKRINVSKEILKSRFGNRPEAKLAKSFITDLLKCNTEPTLIVFDFEGVVFDHYFTRTFGEIYEKAKENDSEIDVIFKIRGRQKDVLFRGILEYIGETYSREENGDIINFFTSNDNYIKLIESDDEIIFVATEDLELNKIIKYINENQKTNFDVIHSNKLLLSGEELSSKIKILKERKFIYFGDTNDEYNSVYTVLKPKL